jgi:hypothetical protein
MKKSEKNPNIRKFSRKEEDQACHQEESSGQSYNQKAPSFQTPQSGNFESTLQSGNTKKFNPTKKKVRKILLLENSQKNKKKINLVFRKNLQEASSFQNPMIVKVTFWF